MPVLAIFSLYFPVGINYGRPRYQHIMSALASDKVESLEFFSLIPFQDYLLAIILLVCLIGNHILIQRKHLFFFKSRMFLLLALTVSLVLGNQFNFFR